MRREWGWAGVAALVLVVGCDDGRAHTDESVAVEMFLPKDAVTAPASMEAATGSAADAPRNVTSTAPLATPDVSAPRMAYVYRYGLELPADRAAGLMGRHEAACVAAGAATCQVIGSETTRYGRDEVSSQLTLRATPAWVAGFRGRLAGEAEAAGGRVASSATTSEDLTRAIVDTEARLRAQTTLRDRLQSLLASRSGSLEELLKVESELARVQGEIDAVQSNLVVMRTRVATSRLEISYAAAGQLAPDSAFRPVTDAVDGALGAFMTSVAAVIWVTALLLPILLIVVPIVWIVLRRRRSAKAKKRVAEISPKPASDTIRTSNER